MQNRRHRKLVGPEYPGEGAINYLLIAGSIAVEDLLKHIILSQQIKSASSLVEAVSTLTNEIFIFFLATVKRSPCMTVLRQQIKSASSLQTLVTKLADRICIFAPGSSFSKGLQKSKQLVMNQTISISSLLVEISPLEG